MHSNFYEDILQSLFQYATHIVESECYVKCGSPPPLDIPQLTNAHQPYTEPSIEDELDDDSPHQHHCTSDPSDFIVYEPTDNSPYQHLHQCGPDDSTYARTLDNGLQRMILKLLNQGGTREHYRTLMIAATFYSSGRGEDKGKLLSNAVKESRDCIRFYVCSTVSGEMVNLLHKHVRYWS